MIWDIKFSKLLEKRGVTDCIECFAKINCYNYDIGISGEKRGDSEKDRYNNLLLWLSQLGERRIDPGGWKEREGCVVTSHSTHYRSFRRQFYGSHNPTNSVIALKEDG